MASSRQNSPGYNSLPTLFIRTVTHVELSLPPPRRSTLAIMLPPYQVRCTAAPRAHPLVPRWSGNRRCWAGHPQRTPCAAAARRLARWPSRALPRTRAAPSPPASTTITCSWTWCCQWRIGRKCDGHQTWLAASTGGRGLSTSCRACSAIGNRAVAIPNYRYTSSEIQRV